MPAVGFLLAEEEAMKAKFSGLTLAAPRKEDGQVKVKVWYRGASPERITEYPNILIDLVDIVPALDRAHSQEYVNFDYWPSSASTKAEALEFLGMDPLGESESVLAMRFFPVDLIFQVATRTRTKLHDAALRAKIITQIAPFRFGYLNIPADGSTRHLDLRGWSSSTDNEGTSGKSTIVFTTLYEISVTAEIPLGLPEVYERVQQILISLGIEGDADTEDFVLSPTP
jgi:hypothetical protein